MVAQDYPISSCTGYWKGSIRHRKSGKECSLSEAIHNAQQKKKRNILPVCYADANSLYDTRLVLPQRSIANWENTGIKELGVWQASGIILENK
jgi:hypothetical protein